jgi:hypothetical protein
LCGRLEIAPTGVHIVGALSECPRAMGYLK